MRNPNRLDSFYEKWRDLHKECMPDWRFGQLCSNFFGWLMSEKNIDLFFPEESNMLELFEEYCKGVKKWE